MRAPSRHTNSDKGDLKSNRSVWLFALLSLWLFLIWLLLFSSGLWDRKSPLCIGFVHSSCFLCRRALLLLHPNKVQTGYFSYFVQGGIFINTQLILDQAIDLIQRVCCVTLGKLLNLSWVNFFNCNIYNSLSCLPHRHKTWKHINDHVKRILGRFKTFVKFNVEYASIIVISVIPTVLLENNSVGVFCNLARIIALDFNLFL